MVNFTVILTISRNLPLNVLNVKNLLKKNLLNLKKINIIINVLIALAVKHNLKKSIICSKVQYFVKTVENRNKFLLPKLLMIEKLKTAKSVLKRY